jgi:hypothetical protein
MYSTKKFEIVQTDLVDGKPNSFLVFESENESDIMNKLREPEMYEIREKLSVRNNHTHQFDYAWRILVGMNDVQCFDA